MLVLYGLVVLLHPMKSNQDPNKINQKTNIQQTQKHNMTLENLHLQRGKTSSKKVDFFNCHVSLRWGQRLVNLHPRDATIVRHGSHPQP